MSRRQRTIVFLCAILLPLIPILLYACGPYFSSAIFVPQRPAENTDLINGKTGLVRPSYTRRQLFFAYRNLSRRPLNESERASLKAAEPDTSNALYESSARWAKTVGDALGSRGNWVDGTRTLKNYSYFVNCTAESFDTATDHLEQLIASEGGITTPVRQWAGTQELVFDNCAKDAGVPSPPTADMTADQKADRLYQIAAAHFYQMKYDTAAEEFEAIAHDASSEWQEYGLFLAARCYLRKATVGSLMGPPQPTPRDTEPVSFDDESMRKALGLLQQVADDKSLTEVHGSALRLISFAELHLHPEEQTVRLSSSLTKPSQDEQFATHLTDYLHLLRDGPEDDDELGEWIAAVQQPAQSSIDRWKAQPDSQPWLVAALLAAEGNSSEAPELISAALKVGADAPAFSTAQYQAARMRFQRGDLARVREQIDTLLKTHKAKLDASTVAALTILRSRAADSVADFSNFAAMQPTGFDIPEDGDGAWEPCKSESDKDDPNCASQQITPAAAAMINHMPLSVLIRLASMQSAPASVRHDVAVIALERGVLLNDFSQAEAAARLLSTQDRRNAEDLKDFLAAHNDDERRFTAAFVMLHWPGATPSLYTAFIREAAMRELSNFRNNWWAVAISAARDSGDPLELLPSDNAPPGFLSKEERSAAERECAELSKTESAAIWLPRVVIAWAKTHRNDSRVPEALHLAVNATHFGADTKGATPYSKQAFELLHRNYPKSSWAEETKYYY